MGLFMRGETFAEAAIFLSRDSRGGHAHATACYRSANHARCDPARRRSSAGYAGIDVGQAEDLRRAHNADSVEKPAASSPNSCWACRRGWQRDHRSAVQEAADRNALDDASHIVLPGASRTEIYRRADGARHGHGERHSPASRLHSERDLSSTPQGCVLPRAWRSRCCFEAFLTDAQIGGRRREVGDEPAWPRDGGGAWHRVPIQYCASSSDEFSPIMGIKNSLFGPFSTFQDAPCNVLRIFGLRPSPRRFELEGGGDEKSFQRCRGTSRSPVLCCEPGNGDA